MPNWSTVIIARNEEKTLSKMLGSLKEFIERGGEVIIVDTGSTDNTVQVARDLGCKVYEEGDIFRTTLDKETCDKINEFFEVDVLKEGQSYFDYSAARNYAASLASNNLVAMPDADECYTVLNLDKIQKTIEDGASQLEYSFVFSHDEFGREAVKFTHCKFYDRTKLQWKGVIHETLSGEANRVFLGEDTIKLEHFQNQLTDRSGYLVGLVVDCYNDQSNDRNSHYLGRELLWKGYLDASIKELKRHLEISWWKEERGQSMIYIGEALLRQGKDKEAIEWFHKSIEECSTRRAPFMALADYYFKKNDALNTAIYCAAMLQIPLNGFYANNTAHYQEIPHEMLYWAKWELGDREGAKEHFLKALSYAKKEKYLWDARFFMDLPKVTVILPTLGRPEGLKRCLDSIKNLAYPQELIETIVMEDVPRKGVPLRVKEGYERGTGDVFLFASNDIELTPYSLIHAVVDMLNGKMLVSFNTGEFTDDGNICEHFIIHKDLIPQIGGEIFDTEFYHVGVDKLLWEKAKKLGQAKLCREAIVKHHHFSRIGSGIEKDSVNELGWSHAEEDRKLLDRKLKELSLMN